VMLLPLLRRGEADRQVQADDQAVDRTGGLTEAEHADGALAWSRRHTLDEAVDDAVAGKQCSEAVQIEFGADLGAPTVLSLVHRQIVDQHAIAQQREGTGDAGIDRQDRRAAAHQLRRPPQLFLRSADIGGVDFEPDC
jgi:hypothetical protein